MVNPPAAIRLLFWQARPTQSGTPSNHPSRPSTRDIYHFNDLQIDPSYLAGGFGIVIGGYLNGKLNGPKLPHDSPIAQPHNRQRSPATIFTPSPLNARELAAHPTSWQSTQLPMQAIAGPVQACTHEAVPLIPHSILAALFTTFQQRIQRAARRHIPRKSKHNSHERQYHALCSFPQFLVAVFQPLMDVMGEERVFFPRH